MAGKPVTISQVAANAYAGVEPKPLVVVGDIPAGTPVALTAVPGTFADLAAVRTYLNTLVTELKTSGSFS